MNKSIIIHTEESDIRVSPENAGVEVFIEESNSNNITVQYSIEELVGIIEELSEYVKYIKSLDD